MPELPDIECYLHALRPRVVGQPLECVRLRSPFLLRSVDPPVFEIEGKSVRALSRLGKRIVFHFDDKLFMVLHLMIAGRLHWKQRPAKVTGKTALAAFDLPDGSLLLTEAGTKRRASLHMVRGLDALQRMDPGGIEPLDCSCDEFGKELRVVNHTLKRALADPRIVAGIGNAFSDEILHRAGLSPFQQTQRMTDEQLSCLYDAMRDVLQAWTGRLIAEVGDGFPEKVTAFRDDFAVHGRFGKPCPACGTKVQRIRYAENETNYCPRCQTGGKVYADRSLSRLLKDDWPRRIEELGED